MPYIVNTIGVEKFGLVTFSYAFMAYFQLLVEYGFNSIATKDISLYRGVREKYSQIFWTIMASKLIIFLLSLMILLVLLNYIDILSSNKYVYIFSLGLVFSRLLFPIWFLQGMEEMKYIAIFTVVGRTLYTISIFLFIENKNDFILVPLLNSISLILIALISYYFVVWKFKIIFLLPKKDKMMYYFKEGWYLFLSSVTTNLYTTTNTILLGSLTNYTAVGIFTLAETISSAATQLIGQFNKVIYPHLAKYANNKNKLVEEAKKYLKYYFIVLIILSSIIVVFADLFIWILFGEGNSESVVILQVLAITLTLSSLGGFYTRYMIINSKQKEVLKITFSTLILNFILIIPFILSLEGLGVALAKVIVESWQVLLNSKENKEIRISFYKG